MLFPVAAVGVGLGMVAAGVGVLRAGRWRGWQRWVPLLCGLYPFVIIFPAFGAAGQPVFLLLSVWGVCWLILALTLGPHHGSTTVGK